MRIIILLLLALLILVVLVVSDFFIVRIIKNKIKAINSDIQKITKFTPISFHSTLIAGLLFWIIPLTLLPKTLNLEYRVLLTLMYWLFLVCTYKWYYLKKIPRLLVYQVIIFMFVTAFIFGAILIPIVTLINDNSVLL